jgi:L-ascorbate metabolism protein UlaG (beta-lactamase superfamily)
MNYIKYLFFSSVIITLSACSSSIKNMPVYHSPDPVLIQQVLPENSLTIQYLGVGGQLLRFGKHAIMTAPSITNPHFLVLGPFMPISADEEMIDRYLPDVSDVETILVGHAHYDHLMDVPYVMETKAKNAHVYGSKTMVHSIAPAVDESRRHAVNDSMAILDTPGQWHYNESKTIRFMAIKSTHAPHFMGINIMTGTYEEDLESLPWHAFGWKEGQTLSYLIDFLGAEEEILHRVYYQDAASQEPLGLIPELVAKDQKQVDIAIITPASFHQVDNYPESIMKDTKARHFVLGHWEDFFDNQEDEEPRFVRAVNSDDFFNRFEKALPKGSNWTMPLLYNTQYFAPHGKILTLDQAEK